MKTLNYTGTKLDGQSRIIKITEPTMNKIKDAEKNGYTVLITKTYTAPKGFEESKKICQTNDTNRGYIKHCIWAVK